MYSKMKSCVQTEKYLSDDFDCNIGTRQGCQLSPPLFVLHVYELTHLVEENNYQDIYVDEHNPNVTMLLYVDDLGLIGDQIDRVQKFFMYCLSSVTNGDYR